MISSWVQAQDLVFKDGFEDGGATTQLLYLNTPSASSSSPALVTMGSNNNPRVGFTLVNNTQDTIYLESVRLRLTSTSGVAIPFRNFTFHLTQSGDAAVTTSCGQDCYLFTFTGYLGIANQTNNTQFTLYFDIGTSTEFPNSGGSLFTMQMDSVTAYFASTFTQAPVAILPGTPDYIKTN